MNKTLVTIFIACGLLVLDAPDAAAHEEYRPAYRVPAHYRGHRHAIPVRASSMPRWLKEDRSFRHWYKHSRLQYNLYLSWHDLFDVYCRENYRERHRRSHSHRRY